MARSGFQGNARKPNVSPSRKLGEDGFVYVRIAKDGNHNELMEQYRAPYVAGMTHTGMGAVSVPELETESSYTLKYPESTAKEYEKFCVDAATARRSRKPKQKRGANMEQEEDSSEVITTLGEQVG